MPNFSFNPDLRFARKVSNFAGSLYRINDPTSRIHRLLYALLEIGVAQAKGTQDLALIAESSLATTTGQELDQYFEMFGIRRSAELTDGVGGSSPADDAKFRVAISKFLQALSLGGTAAGIRLMSEASTGYKCDVVEPWRNPELDLVTDNARLVNGAGAPIGNEIVIFVYPNVILSLDEINLLRARTVSNCKIIAPLHTSITVTIMPAVIDSEFVPSYVSSGSFSFISEAYSDALPSQEAEISLNNSVTNIKVYEVKSDYNNFIGNPTASINASATVLTVAETVSPLSPTFYLKIVEGNKEEIVFVKKRTFVEFDTVNVYTYEIDRAQSETSAQSFTTAASLYSNMNSIYSQSRTVETVFEDWQPIPLSDSYDNYPMGKYPNDPNKYDSNGNYLFEWANQNAFNNWFTDYVTRLGGEVVNGQYRMSVTQSSSVDAGDGPNIINQIMGSTYNFIRPVPGVN